MKTNRSVRLQHKDDLIRTLAKFLSADVGRKSIELEMGKPDAKAWAELRNACGIMGYLDEGETESHLRELLG